MFFAHTVRGTESGRKYYAWIIADPLPLDFAKRLYAAS